MEVSIITVTYNSSSYIIPFLESIFFNVQNDLPWELILVDNASTDDGIEKIDSFISKNEFSKKIKFLKSEKNLGFGGGNNLGVKNSSGNILIFLNPDTIVKEGWLEPLVEKLTEDKSIGIVGPKILYGDDKTIQSAGGYIEKCGFSHHFGYGEEDKGQWDEEKSVDYVTGACLAIRKKLFQKCLGFDQNYFPAYFEETELCTKIKKLGYSILYLPASSIMHMESQSVGLQSYNYYFWFHKHRLRYVLKNTPLIEIIFSSIPFEATWLFRNFLKKSFLKKNDCVQKKEKSSPEKKALFKAYLKTLISIPNIFYYRFFRYYER